MGCKMKLIFRYMKKYKVAVFAAIFIKLIGTMSELSLPYILEYMIDYVVPSKDLVQVVIWGLIMFAASIFCRQFNVMANRKAIYNAHKVSYDVRGDLFKKTANLSGDSFDEFTLPSLISRMTSDSYNVQSAVQQLQSLCVRAPMMLLGGVIMTLFMDFHLAMILIVMLPFLIGVVLIVSLKGIPIYTKVQQRLDSVVRIMRENITGIRVVKALSKADYEKRRFSRANEEMAKSDIRAGTVMAIPGPFMQLCLNVGLTFVVIFGAKRVNDGLMQPGIILAFLTYFNMITMGVMGLNRIFMSLSKASASADRIDDVLKGNDDWIKTDEEPVEGDDFISFENVSFSYGKELNTDNGFAGGKREKALDNISFSLKKGESLGIIGPTGCGKTTIINLLMRFYDPDEGSIRIDGKSISSFDKDELRSKFGAVFQNDMIFKDSLYNNIDFGRNISKDEIAKAIKDALADEYINALDKGLEYQADIKGANLSGGQKQRLLVARALAGRPQILVLDDSSSALDYKTDSAMRKAIKENHKESTLILIAQRVSSVMGMDKIMVMDNGKCIGLGTHKQLMESCSAYRETYEMQTT
ncbi:ATP-binding cassette, subfamily B [Butyrivibrio sp. Su6]|uniref:ABC transporter ATP-binding protein n=1 Tax=Butyrivibrio sp. Su6 TaxID=1520810 RepID=UPI00089EE88B|nr:ABC transporter ATP-binding protein [Butyrivibrio sp. Su6]SEG28926.1 ATP-binding cassette, subfamily B [Butyrivibrio sp. Su6]